VRLQGLFVHFEKFGIHAGSQMSVSKKLVPAKRKKEQRLAASRIKT
jgi:hypothetical protein